MRKKDRYTFCDRNAMCTTGTRPQRYSCQDRKDLHSQLTHGFCVIDTIFFRPAALKFNLIFVQVLMIRQDWECLKLPGKRSVGNVHLKFPRLRKGVIGKSTPKRLSIK